MIHLSSHTQPQSEQGSTAEGPHKKWIDMDVQFPVFLTYCQYLHHYSRSTKLHRVGGKSKAFAEAGNLLERLRIMVVI